MGKRLLKWLFIIALLIPSLYWIPVNLFLMAGMIPKLASEGEGKSFNVHYTGAWSFTPGILHVRGLHLDGTDPNVRWDVKIDSAVLHHSLKALKMRQVQVTQMDADGIWVKIRQHLPAEKPAVMEKLGPPSPPPTDGSLPWLLAIHGIHLKDFHHAELDSMVFNGDSEIIGDFTLLPGHELEIKPSEWKILKGSLNKDESPIFTEMNGSTLVTIHKTDLQKTHGSQIFNTMDILNTLQAKVLSSDFFGLLYRPYEDRINGRTEGDVNTHVDLKGGVLQVGSAIQSNLNEAHVELKKTTLDAHGELKWQVVDAKPKPKATFSFLLKNAFWKKEQRNLASVPVVTVYGFSSKLSVLDLFSDVQVAVAAKKIKIIPLQDIVALFATKPNPHPSLQVDAGLIDIDAVFKAAIRRVDVELGYASPKLELTYNGGKTTLIGSLDSRLKIFTSRTKGYEFELGKTHTDLKSIRIMNKGEEEYKADNWTIGLALEGGRFTTAPAFNLDGSFRVKMTDLKLPIRFIAADSFFAKLGTSLYPMRDFAGEGLLHVDQNEFGLRDFKATTSNGPIHGALINSDEGANMAFFFSMGIVKMCLMQKVNDPDPGIHLSSKIDECEGRIKSYNERPH